MDYNYQSVNFISSTLSHNNQNHISVRNHSVCSMTGFEPFNIDGREVYLKSGGSIFVILISFFNYFLFDGRELPSSFALGQSCARKILLVVIELKFNILYGTRIYGYFLSLKKEGKGFFRAQCNLLYFIFCVFYLLPFQSSWRIFRAANEGFKQIVVVLIYKLWAFFPYECYLWRERPFVTLILFYLLQQEIFESQLQVFIRMPQVYGMASEKFFLLLQG